jgi:hypothetical protein
MGLTIEKLFVHQYPNQLDQERFYHSNEKLFENPLQQFVLEDLDEYHCNREKMYISYSM